MGKTLVIKDADFSTNGILPEFERLDWIGMSDDYRQYISSGVTLKDNTKIYIEFTTVAASDSFPTANSQGGYLGAQVNNHINMTMWFTAKDNTGSGGNVAKGLFVTIGNNGNNANDVSGPRYATVTANILDGQLHTLEISPSGYIFDSVPTSWPQDIKDGNNNPIGSSWGNDTTKYDYSSAIYLDASSRGGTVSDNTYNPTRADFVRVRCFKIYEGDTIVFDGIPVRKTSDNRVGYYDFVSGTYKFRNDGSTPVNSQTILD